MKRFLRLAICALLIVFSPLLSACSDSAAPEKSAPAEGVSLRAGATVTLGDFSSALASLCGAESLPCDAPSDSEAPLDRCGAARLLSAALSLLPEEGDVECPRPGAAIADWEDLPFDAREDVTRVLYSGLLTLAEDGCFHGEDSISHADAEAALLRLSGEEKRVPLTPPEFDGVFDSGVLFIGDSITHHLVSLLLEPEGYLGGASCLASCNAGLPQFFSHDWPLWALERNAYGVSCDEEFEGMTSAEAVEAAKGRYTSIYMMLGSNGSTDVTVEQYTEVIDYLIEKNPLATVYLQTIPECNNGRADSRRVNDTVAAVVESYDQSGETRVALLDSTKVTSGHTYDGVHLTTEGLQLWYDYICQNEAGL